MLKPATLPTSVYWPLVEALRRRTRYAPDPVGGKGITSQWTGLGSPSIYKQAVADGCMKCTRGTPTPRVASWWRLTEKGARIVAYWIGQGYTHERIEGNDLPSRQIPQEVL